MLIQKEYEQIVPVPYLEFDRISFNSKIQVSIKAMHPSDVIYYSIEDISEDANTGPSEFKKYTKPLTLDRSTKVEAYVKRGEKSSAKIFGKFFKKPNDYSIKIKSNVHPLYTAGGSDALLDGVLGDLNWKKGDWQGYQGTDFEAVIDMKQVKTVQTISANFLQDALPWILVPKKMVVYGSLDGINFEFLGEVPSKTLAEDEIPQIETLKTVFEPPKARYSKVGAVNYGKLPETHLSAGENAYICIDEITIK